MVWHAVVMKWRPIEIDREINWRRVLTALSAVVVLGGLVFATLSYRWFINPSEQEPGTADVVYVLGGGGSRVDLALDLVRDGVADRIVFSSSYVASQGVWAATPCNQVATPDMPRGTIFECYEADPGTTRGEAQLLADMADERGWESVVVVASTDQVTRARRLIDRCWDGEVKMTSVPHDQLVLARVAYEWGAGIKATFLRGC